MATVNVGLQSDGHVAVDTTDDDGDWQYCQLTIEEATFLHEELSAALERAKRRFPNGTPKKDEDSEDE